MPMTGSVLPEPALSSWRRVGEMGWPEALVAKACAEARSRVPALRRLWSRAVPEEATFMLAVMFEPRTISWVEVMSWEGTAVRGRVAWAPPGERRRPEGLAVWLREDEVCDFVVRRPGGGADGGILARHLRRRSAPSAESGARQRGGQARRPAEAT